MKKRIAQVITVVLCCVLLVLYAVVPVLGQQPEQADIIDLLPNTAANENLFRNISDLLPGAEKSDHFILRNNSNKTCTFYLRPEEALVRDFAGDQALKQKSDALLRKLTLKVEQFNVEDISRVVPGQGRLLYNGTADHLAAGYPLTIGAGNKVELGNMAPNQKMILRVTVSAPSNLGNQYEGMQGKFWWHISAVEYQPAASSSVSSAPPASSSVASSSSVPPVNPPVSSSRPASSSVSGSSSLSISSGSSEVDSTAPGGSGGTGDSPRPSSPGGLGIIFSDSGTGPAEDLGNPSQWLDDGNDPLTRWLGARDAWALVNLILAVLCGICSMMLLVGILLQRRNNAEREADAAFDEEYGLGADEMMPATLEEAKELEKLDYQEYLNRDYRRQEKRRRRSMVWRILAIVTGVISVILFLLTENIWMPMVIVDRWTPLMVIVAVADAVFIVLMRYKNREEMPEEEETDEVPPEDGPLAGEGPTPMHS